MLRADGVELPPVTWEREPFASGKEATLHALEASDPRHANVVLKRFKEAPPDDIRDRLRLMFGRRLHEVDCDPGCSSPYLPIAAPFASVHESARTPAIGLLMGRVDAERFVEVGKILEHRKVLANLKAALTLTTGLWELVGKVHDRLFVMGDISGRNIMFDRSGNIALVDVDSWGVLSKQNVSLTPATKISLGFAAPESTVGPAGATQASDVFGLSVVSCLLLMGGRHPYAGFHPSHPQATTRQAMIDAGASWLFDSQVELPSADEGHLGMATLPDRLGKLVEESLGPAPGRSTAQDWVRELDAAKGLLVELGCGHVGFRGAACGRCGALPPRVVHVPPQVPPVAVDPDPQAGTVDAAPASAVADRPTVSHGVQRSPGAVLEKRGIRHPVVKTAAFVGGLLIAMFVLVLLVKGG